MILQLFTCVAMGFVLFATPVLASGVLVTGRGARCDGITDDSRAIQAAISAAGAQCDSDGAHQMWNQSYIELPSGSTCKINSGLQFDAACVGLVSNGATLDATALSSGAAISVTSSQPQSPFGENVPPWSGVHVIGPGPGTNTIGILVQAGAVVFDKLNVSNFGVGVQFGGYAFLDRFETPMIFNCGTAVNFPSGLSGSAGENITFQGGSIFGAQVGFRNNGGELNIEGMSIDGLSDAAIVNLDGAVRVYNTHIEYFAPIKTSPLEIEGGCNAWTFIDLSGGLIQSDTGTTNVRSTIDIRPPSICGGSGPWISLQKVFLAGLNPSPGCSRGAGSTCVTGTAPMSGTGIGQVVITSSTDGSGGGTMGAAHLP
jgi:hypothetical protein